MDPDHDQSVLTATVPSESRADRRYAIRRLPSGALTCECLAFGYSTADPPTCKHLTAWQLAQLEPADARPVHTFTGRRVYPLRPRPADIALEDIAHALSHQCRFAGHLREFYSTAQHSVLVSLACPPEDALHGLLHDAAEAYFCDLPRPLKHLDILADYRRAETAMLAAIFRRFGLRASMPAGVKIADDALAAREARDLFPVVPVWAAAARPEASATGPIVGWPPAAAKAAFLARWKALRRHARPGRAKGPS